MRALVVDDFPEVAGFVADALRDVENMDVDVAHNLVDAEDFVDESDYDLYVIDVYLEGPDDAPEGLKLVRRIRKKTPEAHILLMTGKSFSRIITDVIFRSNTADLIGKPVDLGKLLAAVRKVLGKV